MTALIAPSHNYSLMANSLVRQISPLPPLPLPCSCQTSLPTRPSHTQKSLSQTLFITQLSSCIDTVTIVTMHHLPISSCCHLSQTPFIHTYPTTTLLSQMSLLSQIPSIAYLFNYNIAVTTVTIVPNPLFTDLFYCHLSQLSQDPLLTICNSVFHTITCHKLSHRQLVTFYNSMYPLISLSHAVTFPFQWLQNHFFLVTISLSQAVTLTDSNCYQSYLRNCTLSLWLLSSVFKMIHQIDTCHELSRIITQWLRNN